MIWNDHYDLFFPLVPKLSAQAERLGTHFLLKLRFKLSAKRRTFQNQIPIPKSQIPNFKTLVPKLSRKRNVWERTFSLPEGERGDPGIVSLAESGRA